MTSEEFKAQFRELMKEAMNEKIRTSYCLKCPFYAQSHVIQFLMNMQREAISTIDKAAQVMEDHITLFKEIEKSLFKEKMRGPE